MAIEDTIRLEYLVRRSVREEIGGLFAELRQFVDRRLCEVSTEVNATVQMVDFSEANLSRQLSQIHDQIARVVALPSATHSSGIELEAVVDATEKAANRIMEAAEAIGVWAGGGANDGMARAAIAEQVATIFEACAFQDLTGQRIRRAIVHLQHVESLLAEMVGGEPTLPALPISQREAARLDVFSPDLDQEDIDRLLA